MRPLKIVYYHDTLSDNTQEIQTINDILLRIQDKHGITADLSVHDNLPYTLSQRYDVLIFDYGGLTCDFSDDEASLLLAGQNNRLLRKAWLENPSRYYIADSWVTRNFIYEDYYLEFCDEMPANLILPDMTSTLSEDLERVCLCLAG